MRTVVLASASPRRLELLRLAGLDPVVTPAQVDERRRGDEPGDRYVTRLACEKLAVACPAEAVVVAADTAVVIDGEVLGKPTGRDAAAQMLGRLSGRRHTVMTAVAVSRDRAREVRVVTTAVEFTRLRKDVIDAYLRTPEPFDKAGAYAIQGRAAAFVARIEGSWTNVVGLPLVETLEMLEAHGVRAAPVT